MDRYDAAFEQLHASHAEAVALVNKLSAELVAAKQENARLREQLEARR